MFDLSNCFIPFLIVANLFSNYSFNTDFCQKNSDDCPVEKTRYLFYDINPPEGFNLRRDVYMRFAVLAHQLHQSEDEKLNRFKLVLPPWSNLMHWKYRDYPEHIPWSYYFDLQSLRNFAPVIEMYEYFYSLKRRYSKVVIDEVYILQHFADMFESGNFEDRMQVENCQKQHYPLYFHYENITSNNVKCLSYHGPAMKLSKLLSSSPARTVLLDHAEVALHDTFGSKIYWEARRSMRFNLQLREIANNFRKSYLNSSDEFDGTFLPGDWRKEKPKRSAKGGPYLAVHLRRKDFVRSRSDETPSLDTVARQITQKLKELKLGTVFVATDAPQKEYEDLFQKLPPNLQVLHYVPPESVLEIFKDGGIAIIDQIICSYARYFIGTHESTFSFRIQEEREILGFPVDTTFNSFCKNASICKKPSVWKIVY